MNLRYCFEIAEDLSTRYCFSYIDTEDNLASTLFGHLKIEAETEMEFHSEDDPFKIVMCHIPREQREDFLRAVDLLPELMAYAGREGYDEFCLDLMGSAARFFARKKSSGGITPLQ